MAKARKTSESEPPARRNRVRLIADDARLEAAETFSRAGFKDPTLLLHWDEIAGPETARIARPVKLSEGATWAVLTLKTEPGAALFLQHESRALLDRINTYLGTPEIVRLRFIQAPLLRRPQRPAKSQRGPAPPASDPAFGFHGPESVRTALLKLAVARQRPARKD